MPDLDPQRAPERLAFREAGPTRELERLPDTPPEAASLAESLGGDYTSADLDATAQNALVDGTLRLTVQGRHGQLITVLTPLSADVMFAAHIDPVLASFGKVVLNVAREAGRVVGLRLNTARTRGLRFQRQESRA